jgi:hypothetical protein
MSADRATWRIAGIAVLGLAVAALILGSHPANLPEPWLERWVLRKLPVGSSIVAVRNTIDAEGWKTVDEGVSDTGSLVIVEIGRAWASRKYAYAHFTFDRFGRLVSVEVEKNAQVAGAPGALR